MECSLIAPGIVGPRYRGNSTMKANVLEECREMREERQASRGGGKGNVSSS